MANTARSTSKPAKGRPPTKAPKGAHVILPATIHDHLNSSKSRGPHTSREKIPTSEPHK